MGAELAHVPASTVFLAATAVFFANSPRISVQAGWGMLVVGLVLGQFGELSGLPVWLRQLSPFRHSAAIPMEPFDLAATGMLSAIALLGAGLAAFLIGRRELTG